MSKQELKILNNKTLIALVGNEAETLQKFQKEFLLQSKQCLKTLASEFNAQKLQGFSGNCPLFKNRRQVGGAEQVSDTLQNIEKTGLQKDVEKTRVLLLRLKDQLVAVRKEVIK